MNKKALILSIPIMLAVLLLGGWFLFREPKSPTESQNLPKGMETRQMISDDFAKYNKTLSRHKITGVTDLEGPYKKVTVSNGTITFSFEVPDMWLTETRNSGEVTMNEEELREFLGTNYDGDIRSKEVCTNEEVYGSNGKMTIEKFCGKPYSDYADADWDTLKSMSYEDMRKEFEVRSDFYPGFPNATVTPDNKIWYTDTGWDQIHFFILDEKTDVSYFSGVTYSKNTADIIKKYREFENAFQRDVRRDKNGEPIIDKGDTWGFGTYIKQKNFVVRIWKEAYVEGEFEEGFKHLVETLSFE